jgi:hypothetical protein
LKRVAEDFFRSVRFYCGDSNHSPLASRYLAR